MNKKFGGKNTNANKVLMFDFLIKNGIGSNLFK